MCYQTKNSYLSKTSLMKSKYVCLFIRVKLCSMLAHHPLKGVTKNSKKIEAGNKGYQARLLKLKEEVLTGTSTGTTTAASSGSIGSTATNPGINAGATAGSPGSNASSTASSPGSTCFSHIMRGYLEDILSD